LTNIDLHCHSTYSDGTLTPTQLIEHAASRGVGVLALTDHDATDGLAEARDAAGEHGIGLINGVEISVSWRERTVHVVGLQVDPGSPALAAGLAAIRAGRDRRAEKIVAAFDAAGITGSGSGARRFVANAQMIGRTHFARFLVERGTVKSVQSAFKRFLGAGQPCFISHQWAKLDEAVSWIRGAGGVAVLAHPGRYPFDTAEMRALLAEFRELGGAAIEVVSGAHGPHHRQMFAKQAGYFGLAGSAGSDYHGPGESYLDLGGLPALPLGCNPVWSGWDLPDLSRKPLAARH
jgi:predicted metal-dependent phosphoesterase TrpH